MIYFKIKQESDKYISEQIERAKEIYPGYRKYEICENGELFLYSLGAYPSIIKDFCESYTFE